MNARHTAARQAYERLFSTGTPIFISVPGRTEIGGNHTDHNQGRVLAASIHLDALACAAPSGDDRVILVSEGYPTPFEVALDDLQPREAEKGTTTALIRGVAARLQAMGHRIGGFRAYVSSEVLPGSGLSSSASIEVLLGALFNYFFNQNEIPAEELAVVGQFAENHFFGKPCGLMDQTACAVGGIIAIDFEDPQQANISRIDFDFAQTGYRLLIVDTGANHADLTADYAAVPAEMKAVAAFLGQPYLRKVRWAELLPHLPELRREVGDRAILRALHFLEENERVVQQIHALQTGDFPAFLALVRESGSSSARWLQNSFAPHQVREQGVSLGIALSEHYLKKVGEGACRVHGGGFAGTIQAFLPADAVPGYVDLLDSAFGKGSTQVLHIRNQGIGIY
ncbi:MAG: galactokinase [Saprospiraceae bacterium]